MLEKLGYTVAVSTDPVSVLATIKEDPFRFDLVITDMTMPAMTGDQLIKEILKMNPGIPIILCSGFSSKVDADQAIKPGARQYIEKPLNRKQLARAVREVLDSPGKQSLM